jgi:hypothetical protein
MSSSGPGRRARGAGAGGRKQVGALSRMVLYIICSVALSNGQRFQAPFGFNGFQDGHRVSTSAADHG